MDTNGQTDRQSIYIDKGIFIPHSQAHKESCSRKGRSDHRHKIFKQNININKEILHVPTIHMLICKCKCLTLPTLLTIDCKCLPVPTLLTINC